MYHKHHTKGIVIWGKTEDSDSRRVNIFTEHFGLISARAQGARGARSKFRPGVQELTAGEFSLVRGKSGWRVVSANPTKNLFEIFRLNPAKLKIVASVLSLVNKLVAEEASETPLFAIVSNFFDFLENAKEEDVALAEALTLARLLHSLGYMNNDPELALSLSSSEIQIKDLELIAPRRHQLISLINQSLKSA